MSGILASAKTERTEPHSVVRLLGASLALALCLLLIRSRLIHFLSLHGRLRQNVKIPLLAALSGPAVGASDLASRGPASLR